MPSESIKFDEVDMSWKKLMVSINENTLVAEFTKIRTFLDDLQLSY